MNTRPNAMERSHLGLVKEQACSVCDATGPSEAHHIDQSCAWTCIPLCHDCHVGDHNGIHRRKAIWRLKKMTELDALGVTIKRFMGGR